MRTKSAEAVPSRIAKREEERDAGGRRRNRRDWEWNFVTLLTRWELGLVRSFDVEGREREKKEKSKKKGLD